MQQLPENILLVDKPSGITSFDVIRRLRKKLNIQKMGHAGTLDPLATGLMIIGIKKGTNLLADYLKLPKTYEANILLGTRTDSGDITGKVVEQKIVSDISDQIIRDTAKSLIGKNLLAVPSYSAIKVDGMRLYKRAHRGEKNIETPVKEMTVTHFTVENIQHLADSVIVSATIDVASGTYIRSIAEDFGRKLGYPATIQTLRRTRIGDFTLEGIEQI